MGEYTDPDLKRIGALVAETEWLVADDRWTEEEFQRLWRAGVEAAYGRRDMLEPLLAHADPAWLARLMSAKAVG